MSFPPLPDLSQITGLAGVLIVAAAFYGVGGWVGRANEPAGVRIITGWGLVTLVMMVAGVGTDLPLSWAFTAWLIVAVALFILGARWRSGDREAAWLLVLALPMALAVSATHASQWDEFTNWLPNQKFLLEFDRFPRSDLPSSLSVFPAYPFGLPLIGHFAATLAQHFVENAGAIFNTLLVAALGSLLARQAGLGLQIESPDKPRAGLLAAGLLAATLLNPTFVPKLTFTTYVDFTTAVTLAVMAWLIWQLAEAMISARAAPEARKLALLSGLAFAALVNLKQPNLVLGVLILGAAVPPLVASKTRVSLSTALDLLVRILLPPAIIFGFWRYHVATQLTGGEFIFRSFADWLWGDAPVIGRQMLLVASKKGGYFGLMIVATVVGVVGLVRHQTPLSRLAFIAATAFWGWNLFLFVSYLGSFESGEARAAASFWRYNTQLGGVAMLFGVYGAARLWHRHVAWTPGRLASIAVCGLVVAAPVLAQRAIAFDRVPPKGFVRIAAAEVASLVPQGSIIGTVDPVDNGEYMVFLRYALYRAGTIRYIGGIDWSSPEAIKRALERDRLSHVWLRGPAQVMVDVFRLELQQHATYLLERTSEGWRIVKEWPTTR